MAEELWLRPVPEAYVPRGPGAGALDRETRDRILDATDRLVRQFGMAKTNMTDVARAASVARGTLYRYFESREALFDALSQRATDNFFAEAAVRMSRCPTLSDQVGEFSELLIRSIRPATAAEAAGRQASMVRMLSTQGGHALRRVAGALRPYVEAARGRHEVRENLDIDDASEWLARILLSFTILQASVSYEADDPASVRRFVQRYAISGLTGT
jgi:AcrR family transcriptional regulator